MEFLILATDGIDSDAPTRRQRAREAHRAVIQHLKQNGHYRMGGHTLDGNEKIIGSAMVLDFPSRAELDRYIASEPYVTQGVWQSYTITRINLG